MRPLTNTCPKPLLKVCGKPILEYIVSSLPSVITEVVLVVGYLQEQIRSYCGDEFLGKKITYCVQENQSGGTGDALMCARNVLKGKFLFMYGDDIHGKDALERAVESDHAILGTH